MRNICHALAAPVEFPSDIPKIRAILNAAPRDRYFFRDFSDTEVGLIWQSFSSDYSAGWLNTSPELLKQFSDWILR